MGYKFSVEALKKKVDRMAGDGLEAIEIEVFDRDEAEGEVIAATLEFFGIDQDGEDIDYGGIEEIEE